MIRLIQNKLKGRKKTSDQKIGLRETYDLLDKLKAGTVTSLNVKAEARNIDSKALLKRIRLEGLEGSSIEEVLHFLNMYARGPSDCIDWTGRYQEYEHSDGRNSRHYVKLKGRRYGHIYHFLDNSQTKKSFEMPFVKLHMDFLHLHV